MMNLINTESAVKKVIAFYQLKQMAHPVYQNKFQAFIRPKKDGPYTFSFLIQDAIDEDTFVYGNTEKDISDIKERELTNDSDLLDKNIPINCALNKVSYDNKLNKLEGISPANQKKIFLHLLDGKVKQKMAVYQSLAQKWILLQMKCFDYYHRPLCLLHSIDGIDITSTTGAGNEWIHDFAKSINNIKINMQKAIAEEFSNEINKPVYLKPYDSHSQFDLSKTHI